MFKLDIPDFYSFVCRTIRTGVLTVFICSHSDRSTDISASFYSRRKDCDVVAVNSLRSSNVMLGKALTWCKAS